jgi:osmotically-inducible protein OsmY
MFRALFLVLLLIAVVWAVFYFYEGSEIPFIGGTLGDAKTTASVKAAFSLHRDLSRRPISVRTRDAVVLLSGEVASELEKREAHRELKDLDISIDVREATVYLEGRVGTRAEAELAREWASSIEGVRAVENLLQLTDVEESADQLVTRVESTLAKNENLRGYSLRARVRDGTVVLEGVVRTGAERELAELLAERVTGGRELRNDIRVKQ